MRYAEEADVQALELPYQGGDVTMLVLLPKSRDGLAALEKPLDPARLRRLTDALRGAEVNVHLPRFKAEQSFELAPVLSAMGMPGAFKASADFSGISPQGSLAISAVLHKAFVEVNEEGTEAAAATGVVMAVTSVPPPPVEFRADHPFVFALRDTKSGELLFLGRFAGP